jgi:hypothetical protein
VVVIVEDDSDGRAMAELIVRSGLAAQFDWLPAGGIGNIKRNAARLIDLARDRIDSGQGCVAVVVDRDGRNPSRDEPHRTIARACRGARAEFIPAREAIEAWFLADPGICGWLGLTPPATSDHIRDPRSRVGQAFYRKTRRPYRRRRARPEVASHSTGIDPKRNGSAGQALAAVKECLG